MNQKKKLLNFLKESNEQTANHLREYILNKYDNPFDKNLQELKELKEASAIGVLSNYSHLPDDITYETCKQAVNILCKYDKTSGYKFKDTSNSNAQPGLQKFNLDDKSIDSKLDEPVKSLRNFEHFLKPIPFASSALSSLGLLLLDRKGLDEITFRAPNRTTSGVVAEINSSWLKLSKIIKR